MTCPLYVETCKFSTLSLRVSGSWVKTKLKIGWIKKIIINNPLKKHVGFIQRSVA